MATADEYASWIVKNADKRGTPEFNTVVQAYELAKQEETGGAAPSAAAPAAPATETTLTGLAGAATRGLALPAAGAALGAMAGAPLAGVGAIPGAVAGAGAATLAGLVADPIVGLVNNVLGTQYTLPTDALSDLLTRLNVAEPKTEAEKIIQATAAGAGGAGGMAAAGRAVQTAAGTAAPVTREVGRMLAAQPVAQVAGGAGAGAAGQAVREAGGTPGGEILASLAGGMAGGMAGARATAPARPAVAPKVQPTIEEASRRGVPVMTSDVIQPETFIGKTAQKLGERVPLTGTGPLRAEQQQARIEAVRGLLREFGAEDAANLSDDVMADLAAKRASDVSRYAGAKKEVINRLSDKGIVPVPKALQAIDDQIDDLLRRKTEGADEAVERLRKIRDDLQNRDLFQLESYRQDELAKVFMDDPARPMSIAAREAGEKALRAIYGPVRDDMGNFIKTTGERRDFDKWMVANKRLSDTSKELNKGSLKAVLKAGSDTPEAVLKLLFSQKPSDIQALYSGLTPAGRANARTAILASAAQKAERALPDGTKTYSPEVFNSELKRLQPQIGVFFKGDELKQVEGLSRVLTLTRRAGEAGVATPTGQEVAPYAIGSILGQWIGGVGSIAAAGGIGLAARVYESPKVRDMMLKLGQTKPGSAEEAAIAKRLLSTIQTQSEAIQQKAQEATE